MAYPVIPDEFCSANHESGVKNALSRQISETNAVLWAKYVL